MEAIGVGLSVPATIKLLIGVIRLCCDLADDIRDWNDDTRKLALRMSLQVSLTQHLCNLLFGSVTSHPNVADDLPLIDRLSPSLQRDVCSMILEFHNVIESKYNILKQNYGLKPPKRPPLLPAQSSLSIQSAPAIASPSPDESKFRFSWVLWGKRRVQAAVRECEQWNERLVAIVQTFVLEDLRAASRAIPDQHVARLKKDADAQALGLSNDIEIAQMTAGDGQNWHTLELFAVALEAHSQSRQVCYGKYDGQHVVLDIKTFDRDYSDKSSMEPRPEILSRIGQLAVLLNRRHSVRARLLPCQGFFRLSDRRAIALVFQFPSGCFSAPTPLRDMLETTKMSEKPSLEARLRLALTLAVALFQFHAVGWVHKSFRSSNILFFPDESPSPSAVDNPYLVGFEYAREDAGFSDNPVYPDIATDIYRHPQTWGKPTTNFQKMHDIYSLGVVLLEIGLWQPVAALERTQFRDLVYSDRFAVQELFQTEAARRLPFGLGSAYAEVVRKCLTGRFDVFPGEEEEGLSQGEYQNQIVDVLRKLAPLFEG
ncbi:hypothetical protein QBC39DRAFT_351436 [Podospora conica]|nr:hypothetical protein QBC39DRAFT_351436 [Schizothecium conicum]